MCTPLCYQPKTHFSWRGGIPVSGPWAALHWPSNCQYITRVDLIWELEIGQSGRCFSTPGGILHPHRTQTTSRHRGLRSIDGVFLFIEQEHTYIAKPVRGEACCTADAGGISGSFHPIAPAPPYFGRSQALECSNEGTWPSAV